MRLAIVKVTQARRCTVIGHRVMQKQISFLQ